MRTLLLSIFFVFGLSAQEAGFVPNAGQWQGDFDYRMRDPQGYVYLKAEEQRVVLLARQHHDHEDHHDSHEAAKGHVYSMRWLGADPEARISTILYEGQPKLNFLLGNNPENWASGLKQYREVTYHDIYPNIDLRYYLSPYGVCSFDFIVHPGAKPEDIRWEIDGIEEQGLLSEDLVLISSIGSVVYTAPKSFQEGKPISSAFRQMEDGTYSFELGPYDRNEDLIIDPTLVFSTYSGSTDDNFGFSATFGEGGMAYGAGINYAYGVIKRGFPTTLGAFQDSSQGGVVDISIAKYTADGTSQVYATYLGGLSTDVPFSLLEGPDKSLIILGVTGSVNFPVLASSFDTSFTRSGNDNLRIGGSLNFPFGSEIFISILDSTGGNLVGSTFFGDSMSDGNNKRMMFNYGDPARGDITIDANGNIILSSYTFSPGLPTGIASNSSYLGGQDGLILSFNSDLSQLNWARYLGGEDNDASFSLRYTNTGRLYVTGATESDTIPYDTTGAYQATLQGNVDVFVAELNPNNGDVLKWTYSGTADDDRAYFIDFTPEGNLVIFGQSFGAWPWVGDNVWGIPSSAQFLQEFDPDLRRVLHSTTFGDGRQRLSDISPTALMVSDCGDIYISGWGAPYNSNLRGNMGDTRGLPVTPNAYRDSADNRGDFYFMQLDASWQRLGYGTFFGQWLNGADHVDGGSSRFRKDGSIFQAVCSCGSVPYGFPITANAFEDTIRSGNCNMAVFRFDMQADTVACQVSIAPGYSDSTCLPADVQFWDNSFNADITLVRDPQGNLDTLRNQVFSITNNGLNEFRFYALDTNCNLIDSSQLQVFAFNDILQADFDYNYDSCDASGTVIFNDKSSGARRYRWDFGDGNSSSSANPTHNYLPGTYNVQLVAEDPTCGSIDSVAQQVQIVIRSSETAWEFISDPCDPEMRVQAVADFSKLSIYDFQRLEWYIDGNLVGQDDSLNFQFTEGGFHQLRLVFIDTLCNRTKEEEAELFFYDESFSVQFPNIFTPNGDGLNDVYTMLELENIAPFLSSASLEIYNRNGQRVFAGDLLQTSWDGQHEGVNVPQAVYYYIFRYEDICGAGIEVNGFLHLQR